ncbi:CalY family protein [Cytobacillus gottheilii]|uniref:M73 family metallopeptidase n=1 Tax=Cytobacillus gottheilii TaxID=859144 RepID=A0ABX8FE74_9BACI|nr:CalY family protein [Cytobacillus gottheilii]QVY62315.1 M73 family metallopeptidase [Cytobacillus gottheilii]
MSIKKKLGLGIASAALGMSLVGGGTFAYFNDVEETKSTFAAGTLDLGVDPTTIIDVTNIKPGDWMNRTFELQNNGSLDISEVILSTDYTVTDVEGDNTDDFGKHIRVNFLENEDKSGLFTPNDIIYSTTLHDLKGTAPDAVQKKIWSFFGERSGLAAGTSDNMYVQFEFVDNDADQNEFQGDSLELKWTFDAKQTEGERR